MAKIPHSPNAGGLGSIPDQEPDPNCRNQDTAQPNKEINVKKKTLHRKVCQPMFYSFLAQYHYPTNGRQGSRNANVLPR